VIVDDQDRRSWLHGSSLAPRPAAGIGADPDHISGAGPHRSSGRGPIR
jgi:hypothetical protein